MLNVPPDPQVRRPMTIVNYCGGEGSRLENATIVISNELVKINLSIDKLATFVLKLGPEDMAIIYTDILC